MILAEPITETMLVFPPVNSAEWVRFTERNISIDFPLAIQDEKPDGARTVRMKHAGRDIDNLAIWAIGDAFEFYFRSEILSVSRLYSNR